jgi:hypothetical protein
LTAATRPQLRRPATNQPALHDFCPLLSVIPDPPPSDRERPDRRTDAAFR